MRRTTHSARLSLIIGWIASLIIAGDAQHHARAAGVPATAKIASWNIKGIPPIGDARVPAIVRGISMMDADLIALLEVRPRDQINSILGGLRCNMVPPNAFHAHDVVNFSALNPVNYLRIISSEELAGQGSFVLLGQPQLLLDGYAIARHHTREYIECSLRVVPLDQLMGLRPRRYARQVSDHLPLMATFDIGMDDD